MKKTIKLFGLFLVTVLLISCSSNKGDDVEENQSLHPPVWIQGTWLDNPGSSTRGGFKFVENDVFTVLIISGRITEHSTLEGIANRDFSIDETKTNTKYEYTLHYFDTNSSEKWSFEKKTATEIEYTNNLGTKFIYVKQ